MNGECHSRAKKSVVPVSASSLIQLIYAGKTTKLRTLARDKYDEKPTQISLIFHLEKIKINEGNKVSFEWS